jgi:hypothetical protein
LVKTTRSLGSYILIDVCRALCDIKQSGKLNNEQFALAMWFVARCLKGVEPPPTLTPDMVPPSFRSVKSADGLVVSVFNFFYVALRAAFRRKKAFTKTYRNIENIKTAPNSMM